MTKKTLLGWVTIGAAAVWLATGCATQRESGPDVSLSTAENAEANRLPEIKWGYSLPDGLKIASETRKPVIVDFYAPWCVACRLTDQRIYSREDVVKTSWALVPVKIDVDEKPGIASKYGVRELPTVLFLNSEGKEISRVSGLLPAEGMIQRMEQAVTAEASAF